MKRARHETKTASSSSKLPEMGDFCHAGYMSFLRMDDLAACTLVCRQQRSNVHSYLSKARDLYIDMMATEPDGRLLESYCKQLRRLTLENTTTTRKSVFRRNCVLRGLVNVIMKQSKTLTELDATNVPLSIFMALLNCSALQKINLDTLLSRFSFEPKHLELALSPECKWKQLVCFEYMDHAWADRKMIQSMLSSWSSLRVLKLNVADIGLFTSCLGRDFGIAQSLRELELLSRSFRSATEWERFFDALRVFQRLCTVSLGTRVPMIATASAELDDVQFQLPRTVETFRLGSGQMLTPRMVYGDRLRTLHMFRVQTLDLASILRKSPELQNFHMESFDHKATLQHSTDAPLGHEQLFSATVLGLAIQLSDLRLHWCTQSFPRLRRLNVSLPSDTAIDGAQVLAWLQGLASLHHLTIAGSLMPAKKQTSAVATVYMPSLLVLHVTGGFPLLFFDHLDAPALQTLHVSKNATLASLDKLLSTTARLTRLKLSGLDELQSIATVPLPTLKRLELAKCASLPNSALLAILHKGAPLRELELSECAKLDDAALAIVSTYASTRLQRCTVRDPVSVFMDSLCDLVRLAPVLNEMSVLLPHASSQQLTKLRDTCRAHDVDLRTFGKMT